jgi:AcrR family transcriptional regulator
MENSRNPESKEEPKPEDTRPRSRGRPKGRTAQGEKTREELYRTALGLIASRGFEETTLRDIAEAAEVSPGLLYKYFPSKRALVLALYEDLSVRYAAEAASLSKGTWRERYLEALRTSLRVLGPHRTVVEALIPVMISRGSESLFAPATSASRARVQPAFLGAVTGASDAPKPADAAALGRLLYLSHLGVLLFWMLDRSRNQRATAGFLALLASSLPLAALALKLGPVRTLVRNLDGLFRDALFGDAGDPLEHKEARA